LRDHRVGERPFCGGLTYNGFVDPSGGSNDSFTLAISHVEAERVIIDVLREARPPFSPENVVGEFCELLNDCKVRRVLGDRYGGLWPRERFAQHGVTYLAADKTASQLFLELLPLIDVRRVGLLDHRRTIDQLINLERRTAFGTGRDTIGHPPNCHDDLAVVVAGAAVLATAKKPQMRMGAIDFAKTGKVTWLDEELESTRVPIVNVSECEALRQKAEGTW
jgi:hypothetical protein